ncbi:MAG: MFS transporter [Clostridia bacterium]|nr:MFS transporter [Clostridia bacterium]
MKPRFSAQQKRVLTMCVVIYTAAYVCRLNLSAALSSMMQTLHLSMARGGMLQTLFAAIYAAGQFVNGSIVDRVNPAKYMLLGLAGSAVCNLTMGVCSSYGALLVVWSLNAVFQSMLWTPIVRLLALYFRDDASRKRANQAIALMLIAAHFAAWAISGFVSAAASWQLSFIIPGCTALLAIAITAKDSMALDVSGQIKRVRAEANTQEPVLRVLLSTGFFLVIITCVLYGFIRDSVVTWTPTILSHISGGDAVSSAAFTLILPVINVAGVLLGFRLCRQSSRSHIVVMMMMLAASACSAAMLGASGMLITALLLGLICASMYGSNSMLTGLIPLEYDRVGRTSLTAGMVDSFIYAGSALSGTLAGGIYETLGANVLFGSWIFAGALSAALMLIASRMSKRYWSNH